MAGGAERGGGSDRGEQGERHGVSQAFEVADGGSEEGLDRPVVQPPSDGTGKPAPGLGLAVDTFDPAAVARVERRFPQPRRAHVRRARSSAGWSLCSRVARRCSPRRRAPRRPRHRSPCAACRPAPPGGRGGCTPVWRPGRSEDGRCRPRSMPRPPPAATRGREHGPHGQGRGRPGSFMQRASKHQFLLGSRPTSQHRTLPHRSSESRQSDFLNRSLHRA